MEALYIQNNVETIDHFAQDGLAPSFSNIVDKWDEQHFKVWCDYHYSVCREESILGASNHVIIVVSYCLLVYSKKGRLDFSGKRKYCRSCDVSRLVFSVINTQLFMK